MKNIIAAGSLAIATSFAAPAFAVTVANDGIVCESSGSLDASVDQGSCSVTFGDFPTATPGDQLTFQGSGTIFGFLADNTDEGSEFGDFVTVVLQKDSDISFSLIGSDPLIDVTFFFDPAGSTPTGTTVTANGMTSLFATAGTYTFGVDATSPTDSLVRLETSYSLSITAVPLPASGLMLLAGLGAIGVARRRRKTA